MGFDLLSITNCGTMEKTLPRRCEDPIEFSKRKTTKDFYIEPVPGMCGNPDSTDSTADFAALKRGPEIDLSL